MWKLLSTTAIVLAVSTPVWADEMTEYSADRSNYPFLGTMDQGAWTSDTLIGQELTTADGETIGEIQSLVFTPDDRILGVVVDAGGFMGVESRPVLVDWYAINFVPEEERFSVDLTQDQLAAAPEMEDEQYVELWRGEKEAEVPDVAETQPGVLPGEETDETPAGSPAAGGKGGGVSGGESETGGANQ